MSGLFGSSSATATAANSLGDLTKDITLNNPPEDSISDLSFSPVSNHLAVASWDSKVRIYEVNAQGGEGKAMYDHQGPVLSTHWSSVCSPSVIATIEKELANLLSRMAKRLFRQAQTRQRGCWIWDRDRLQLLLRLRPTISLFDPFDSLPHQTRRPK